MGGSRSSRRKGGQANSGDAKRGRDTTWHADTRNPSSLNNEAFEQYYRAEIVPEPEWEAFIASMRTALPTAMRINATMTDAVTARIQKEIRAALAATNDPSTVGDLTFIPRGLGVQATVSRGELKRSTAMKTAKQIITTFHELGYLTRQEAVSMIPPLLLDAQEGDRVLDMCAAPGSKTGQLLEAVMGSSNHPRGVVVANDVNAGRMDVLATNTGRMPRAHGHLIVTQHDAMQYPLATRVEDKFDRVLCDVMCSGDGTLRKSFDMWSRWSTLQGPELFISQSRCLTRGMQLCRKGGVVVYSTCSLNPFEDEAVISACVEASKGSFRIADTTTLLPNLQRTPGRTEWRFLSKSLRDEFTTYEEAHEAFIKNDKKGFNPKPGMFANKELLTAQGIHNTMRVLPHQQDTGGFFIAKLECLDDFPDSLTAERKAKREQDLKPISAELQATVKEAMGFDDDFPLENLYCRSETAREQKFYYLAPGTIDAFGALNSRIVNAGAKVLQAYAKYSNTKLLFSPEGIYTLAPLLPARFFVDVDAKFLLDVEAAGGSVPLSQLEAATGKSRADLPTRCFILRVNIPDGFGEMLVPAELGDVVQIKLRERQVMLLKYSLGMAIVEEKEEEKKAGDDEKKEVAAVAEDSVEKPVTQEGEPAAAQQ